MAIEKTTNDKLWNNMLSSATNMCGGGNMCKDGSFYDGSKKQKSSKDSKPTVTNRVSTTNSNPKKYSYNFDRGRTDKRVSLNVAPLVNSSKSTDESFANRVTYVLGQKKLPSKYVYGFLYGCLNKSCGLIFPYTPNLSFRHQVNYDVTDIFHSNLSAVHYKNSPPPSISLDATFTADTRDNALHMLSAIWFLRAVSKCDFGEHSGLGDNNYPGLPPPILYLNGYNQLMDNIPVVVESFSYTLPENKDYVSLGINLNTTNPKFIYNYTNDAEPESGTTLINGLKVALEDITSDKTNITTNGKATTQYYFNNWLPTELKFNINLKIVPNLLKYKKQFDLNKYKMGIYNLSKLSGNLFIPSSEGNIDCSDLSKIGEEMIMSYANEDIRLDNEKYKIIEGLTDQYEMQKTSEYYNNLIDKNKNKAQQILDSLNQINNNLSKTDNSFQPKSYKFDKSGWTW